MWLEASIAAFDAMLLLGGAYVWYSNNRWRECTARAMTPPRASAAAPSIARADLLGLFAPCPAHAHIEGPCRADLIACAPRNSPARTRSASPPIASSALASRPCHPPSPARCLRMRRSPGDAKTPPCNQGARRFPAYLDDRTSHCLRCAPARGGGHKHTFQVPQARRELGARRPRAAIGRYLRCQGSAARPTNAGSQFPTAITAALPQLRAERAWIEAEVRMLLAMQRRVAARLCLLLLPARYPHPRDPGTRRGSRRSDRLP